MFFLVKFHRFLNFFPEFNSKKKIQFVLGFDARCRRFPPNRAAGENLAMNSGVYDVAKCAVDGWINSPGHRKNLLGAFDVCGIGVARSGTGQFYLTQLLANTGTPYR